MDAYGNYASGSYRARALQTGNFAQKKHDVKQTLSEVSSAVHYAKRRASQVIFTNAAEMTVEARLQEEFRSYMINNPLEDEPSFAGPAAGTRASMDDKEGSHKEESHDYQDSEEKEHQQQALHKRMAAHQMKGMKGRRQSFVMGSDGSSAASMLGKLRGLRDYGTPGASAASEAPASKPEKKLLASSAQSNLVLKKLMRRSRLLNDLDASSSEDDAEEEATTSGKPSLQVKKSPGSSSSVRQESGSPRSPHSPASRATAQADDDAEPHGHGSSSGAAGPQIPALSMRTGRRMSVVLASIPAGTQSAPCTSRIRPGAHDAAKPQTANSSQANSQTDLTCALGLPSPKEGMPSPRVGRRASVIMPSDPSDDEPSGHHEPSSSRSGTGRVAAPGPSRRSSNIANTSPSSSRSQLGREASMSRSLSLSRNAIDISVHGGGESMANMGAHTRLAIPVSSQSHDGTHGGGNSNGFLNKMKGWITRR